MIRIRRSSERGYFDHGWLQAYHTFSFGRYVDREWTQYGALRVLNQDRIAPGEGFGEHGHDNMEIITYILGGELAHRDSTGQTGTLRPGHVQVMSAGSGITHSEFNASKVQPLHLLQMWVLPREQDGEPRYDEKVFEDGELRNTWQLIVSEDGRDGSLKIDQDTSLYALRLDKGASTNLTLEQGRRAYLHVATGSVMIGEHQFEHGDGAVIEDETEINITSQTPAECVCFDLA